MCVCVCVFLFVCVCASLHICISVAAFQNNTKRRQRRGEESKERGGGRGGRRIGVSRIVARSFRAWQAGRKLYRLIDAKDVHNVQLGAACAGLRWQEKTTKQQHTHTHTHAHTHKSRHAYKVGNELTLKSL